MSWLPNRSVTWVTVLPTDEVSKRLATVTAHTIDWDEPNRISREKKFYGYVFNHHFQIASRNMRMFSFNPLVQGKIEATSQGSIVMMKLELFILTRVLLYFWTCFALVSCFFLVSQPWFWMTGVCTLTLLLHVIARANFNQQVEPTIIAIKEVLEGELGKEKI